VDLNFATWPYDFTEIYASDRVIIRNCVAVNSAGADFFDAQAYRVSTVRNYSRRSRKKKKKNAKHIAKDSMQ
jgi:hypothetical protein